MGEEAQMPNRVSGNGCGKINVPIPTSSVEDSSIPLAALLVAIVSYVLPNTFAGAAYSSASEPGSEYGDASDPVSRTGVGGAAEFSRRVLREPGIAHVLCSALRKV